MLNVLIALPILGSLPLFLGLGGRKLAVVLSGIPLTISLLLFSRFDLQTVGMQWLERWDWIPQVGLNYSLGLDGLSLLMVALNGLITLIAVLTAEPDIKRPNLFYGLILLMSGAVNGAFAAQNLILFFLFYELVLIPIYLLISIWGSGKRDYAAIKFLIYTAVSAIFLLGAFLAIYWIGDPHSFELAEIPIASFSPAVQTLLLLALIVAFGIKMPLIPFHTWLPDAYGEASAPVAMLLGGVLSKLGTYGLFRFGLQLLPQAWANLGGILAWWGAIAVLAGALAAIAQKDIKRMVAYSSIGHMGYILLGMAAATSISLTGVMVQMVAHGLILALLFDLVGLVERKVGTRDLNVLNGLLNPLRGLPTISALLILGGMASAGIPGLIGFVAEFLIFQGSYSDFPLPTLIGILGTGLTAVYFVILLNRTCFGKLDNRTAYYPAVKGWERIPGLVLAALILWFGIQPMNLVKWPQPLAFNLSTQVAQAHAVILAEAGNLTP
ncbi:NADH-quinone oxidoreductase subunit M [Thermostichus vulcanus]|uniref:NADH-quinone oxidoreductase subunit M n=1 Tax=Thermostichus vulcanus str. 'Rupite' TaxID=2813851 RepID=A0ABT0CB99_THEVL|nr:NADH-quinone oxidoreductase subunit M [Thermostichus vulcanus str. 'Rupite']